MLARAFTAEDYRSVFHVERLKQYPTVDAFEARCGFAMERLRLETAAGVLACPVKANPPNWQHGRVLYAAARRYLEQPQRVTILDIGTAKGFSALCLQRALDDSKSRGQVISVDVIDPRARVSRNTIAETEGLLTLEETLRPWRAETSAISFVQSTGVAWLEAHSARVHIAFVDGKHTGHVVRREGVLLAARQQRGDLAIFDDVHLPDVSVAVNSLHFDYRLEYLEVLPHRHYAIGVRK